MKQENAKPGAKVRFIRMTGTIAEVRDIHGSGRVYAKLMKCSDRCTDAWYPLDGLEIIS